MTQIDIDELRTWIGRGAEVEDVASARLVAEFRATLDPYLAPVAAGEAPLAIHWCLAPGAAPMSELGPDGTARGQGFMPAVPLPRRMWAGGEITTQGPIPVGARVTRRSTIRDFQLKGGRTGQLVFVAIDHDYLVDGTLAVRDRQDAVFREAAGESAPPAPAPAAQPQPADVTWTIEPSSALLFRYSAITFNSHKIHYDRDYTVGVEGYGGIIVHGPLQGSFAFNLAAVIGARAPARFAYRNLSPLTDGGVFHVKGQRQADGTVVVWTEDAAGRQCMRGTASWD
jgi:3-methylfumaryl-CoA hydratase